MNRFLYAEGNPWTFIDPSGHMIGCASNSSDLCNETTAVKYKDTQAGRNAKTKILQHDHATPQAPPGIPQSTPNPGSVPTTLDETATTTQDYTEAAMSRLGGCSATDLNCTLAQFHMMSAAERLAWLQEFQSVYGTKGWFNAIEGVLWLADKDNILSNSDWSSTVDAQILIGLQDGKRVEKGTTGIDADTSGTIRWAAFFQALDNDRQPATPEDLKVLWGNAEQTTTELGAHRAHDAGMAPNIGDRSLYGWTDIWRAGVRAAPGLTTEAGPVGSFMSTDLFDPRDRLKVIGLGHLTYTAWPIAVTVGDIYNHVLDCVSFWDGC